MNIRTPPNDKNAEDGLLGCIMLRQDSILDVSNVITPEMFYVTKNAIIYKAMLSLSIKGEPVDIISMNSELGKNGNLEEVGGIAYVSSIIDSVPMSTNISYYAKMVYNKYILRKIIKTGEDISEIGFNETDNIDNLIEIATAKMLNLSGSNAAEETSIYSIIKEFDDTQKQFIDKQFSEEKLIGISCGVPKIDGAIDGIRPGHFWSIAGYTSSGKTQFLLNIINNLIEKYPVSFFSLEMSKADIISRLIGIQTGIGMTKIMRHEFSDSTQVELFTKARERLIGSKLKIYSKTSTLDGIIIEMTRDILRNKTKLFAIDYIQLVRSKGKSEYEQITEASQRLQTFARETGCSIIVLSQVSNEQAKEQNQEIHGTKGGGSLPASVDLAIELFNEDKKEERDQKASRGDALPVKAIIKKNRHGRCGYVKLDFTPWNGQFKESTDWDI